MALGLSCFHDVNRTLNPLVPNTPFLYSPTISLPYGFLFLQGVQKGCIGNEWVKETTAKVNFLQSEICIKFIMHYIIFVIALERFRIVTHSCAARFQENLF